MILDQHGNPYTAASSPDYEGTDTGHRMSFWGLSGSGPNAAISGGHTTLKYRARTLRRNNPIVSGGIDSYVANLVGTDISPSWDLDNQEQKQELQDAWDRSVHEMDHYGAVDFYGLQEQVATAMVTDGECLSRFITKKRYSGLFIPFQVQNLESDHLDPSFNTQADNGNEIRLGIEWNGGQRVAYHLWNDHPGESFFTSNNTIRERIPAADIAHTFRPLRPGQQRGGTFLAPLMAKLYEIDQYDDAEVVRKKTAAMWGGFFYNDIPGQQQGAGPQTTALEPGTFQTLKNGWKVSFSEPADVGANYDVFMKTQFRMIARGLGITYEQLTGDLSDVNFSSLRAGLIEFRRLCEMIRVRTLVSQFTRPAVLRWLHVGMLAGKFRTIPIQQYLADPYQFQCIRFIPQAWDYVNPVDDRVAEQMDIRNGLETRAEKAMLRGKSIDKIDRSNAERNIITDSMGLVYDSDPRKTQKSGAIQKAEVSAVGVQK